MDFLKLNLQDNKTTSTKDAKLKPKQDLSS
jgi:hypothetical protein